MTTNSENIIRKLYKNKTFRQLFIFCFIGGLASIVNFIVLIFIVETFNWQPLPANIIAFFLAYQVSFFGHHQLTFRNQATSRKRVVWVKFLVVALFSFILNEGLFAVYLFFIPYYQLALFCTLITVPPITFALAKVWAFK
jgi:putative flippase GtrA